jgi:hypothetical protein
MYNPSDAIPRVVTLARDQAHKINSNILDGKFGDVRKILSENKKIKIVIDGLDKTKRNMSDYGRLIWAIS